MIVWTNIEDRKPKYLDAVLIYYVKDGKETMSIGDWTDHGWDKVKEGIDICFWVKVDKPGNIDSSMVEIDNRFEILDL